LIIIEYIHISAFGSLIVSFFITVHVTRQPNIELSLKDQTNIALTLFNTILETVNTQVELERSWSVIEQDISVQEHWEARKRQPMNQP
jgi:hypothetical protein